MRQEAAARRETYYRDGKPCRNGHYSHRYVADGKCVVCARGRRKRYMAGHPDTAIRRLRQHLIRLGDRRKGPMV